MNYPGSISGADISSRVQLKAGRTLYQKSKGVIDTLYHTMDS